LLVTSDHRTVTDHESEWSESRSLNFSLYTLNGMELLYNLQHCSQALVHHTYMSFLMCAFPPLSVCCCLIVTWTNFCWGRRKVSQEWQKHFSFGQANRLSVKPIMLNAKHMGRSGGMLLRKIFEFRFSESICWLSISTFHHKLTESALR